MLASPRRSMCYFCPPIPWAPFMWRPLRSLAVEEKGNELIERVLTDIDMLGSFHVAITALWSPASIAAPVYAQPAFHPVAKCACCTAHRARTADPPRPPPQWTS